MEIEQENQRLCQQQMGIRSALSLDGNNDSRSLRLFLHAPLDIRKKRVAFKEKTSEEEAKNLIRKKDKQRADNYRYYTRQIWGFSGNYHLNLDTSTGEEFLDLVVMNAILNIK